MSDYFPSQKDVLDYIETTRSAAKPTRLELGYRIGLDMCYYEAVQWVQSTNRAGLRGFSRMAENSNPDSTGLRVVDNDTSLHIQKIAAGTNPNQILVDGQPAQLDSGIEGAFRARVSEEAVNVMLDKAGYLGVAQTANTNVTINGTWGIGLSARLRSRKVGGQPEPDWDIRAFDFDPTKLILDPACIERDLSRHECVIYEDLWTYQKIKETFPSVEIDERSMQTFEQLDPVRMEFNRLSSGRIYSSMARHSKTKGARVLQVHHRDSSGRFPTMYVVIEDVNRKSSTVVNFDNPQSPFGGGGLPFRLLYGHRRSDVIWGMSDTSMLRGDQDSKNLLKTLWMRILQKYAHGRTYIDKRAFGNRPNDDDIRRQFTNAVGGQIMLDLGDKSRNIQMPFTEPGQPPPPFVMEMLEYHAEAMRRKSHKSEGNYGTVKTHVGNQQALAARDDAAEVRDDRIRQFTRTHESLIGVLWATTIKNTKEGNPSTLAALTAASFDEDKIAALIGQDEFHPSVSLTVREETFRPRSLQQKRQDLNMAAQLQQVSPIEAREAMADLQTPITAQDQRMSDEATKAARMCLLGQPWQPRPLGQYGSFFLNRFRDATFDVRAQQNPQVMAILMAAIQQQTEMDVQAQMQSDPALRAQQMQAEQQMAMQAQQAAAQQQAEEQPEQTDVGTLLAQLSGQAPQGQAA